MGFRFKGQKGISLVQLMVYLVLASIAIFIVSRILNQLYRNSVENFERNEIIQMADSFRRQNDICQTVLQALLLNPATAPLVDTANNRLYAPLTVAQADLIGAGSGAPGLVPLRSDRTPVKTGVYEVRIFRGGGPPTTTAPYFFPYFKRVQPGPNISGIDIYQLGNHTKVFSNLTLGQTLFTNGTCGESFASAPTPSPSGINYAPCNCGTGSFCLPSTMGACFEPGTLIKTSQGEKPIESLKVGDSVISYDLKNKKLVEEKITAHFEHLSEEIFEISFSNGSTLNVTKEHPIYVENKKDWIRVDQLQEGDQIIAADNLHATGQKTDNKTTVTEIKKNTSSKSEKVFNLEVSGQHNYFAESILVHNKICSAESIISCITCDCSIDPNYVCSIAVPGVSCHVRWVGLPLPAACGAGPCPDQIVPCN